ncbi:MAG: DEAD/DEAH box helicase [Candidatus Dormibacteria bacterium]
MSSDALSPLIAEFTAHAGFPLDSFQVEAIEKLETMRGVLVSAPTSSGKTIVAEYAIWRCLAAPPTLRRASDEPSRVIYTTPLKALSNQKYHDLCDRYGDSNIGLVTGEHTVNDGATVVVMTTEILRNILYEEPERMDLVRDIILDEVHYIDDFPRGTVWEEVIIEAPPHVHLTGLSATISNVEEIAEWISQLRGNIGVVVRTERPVALELWLSIDDQLWPLFDQRGQVSRRTLDKARNHGLRDIGTRYARRAPDNDLLHVIDRLLHNQMLPAIYFIFSRRGCREALARCAVHGLDLTSEAEKAEIDAEYSRRLVSIEDEDERNVFVEAMSARELRRGIAMHHAGMLPYAKETVERLFQTGVIKVVFATETLSLGLNMPARACVVSSFTKFDGTGFHALTAGELTQLMGRAGRRGIDTVGHGIILKERDVDVRDIYDAAIGGEMAVESKFAPTYTMVITLLRTRSLVRAEALLDKSFGQFQAVRRSDHWDHRRSNLEARRDDMKQRTFRHPRIRCTEKTLTTFLHAAAELEGAETALRRAKRDHWRSGRVRGARRSDPGGRFEQLRRSANGLRTRVQESPCRGCPFLSEHRGHRDELGGIEQILAGGEDELREARGRYRREFHALRRVLSAGGYLEDDLPTDLGRLAGALFGESSLLLSDAIAAGWMQALQPAELAATLAMVVGEDRGRERPLPSRRTLPTPGLEQAHRALRAALNRLVALESAHGVDTLRPLAFDPVAPVFRWATGASLAAIELPGGGDIGDLVKVVKNVYSLLRQMEMALRGHPLRPLVIRARDAVERDLIRRV